MKVEIKDQPNCKKQLQIELPPERFRHAWDRVAEEYRRNARLPGFRPGKTPRPVVEKKFHDEIKDEVTRQLIGEGCREAIKEHDLRVISIAGVEGIEIGPDQSMKFSATLLITPEFELPDYASIPVGDAPADPEPEEVTAEIERIREELADYSEVTDRALADGDFAVIDYEGSLDGKPIDEASPKAGKFLTKNEGFWIKVGDKGFLPGFGAQLLGMNPGETREFDLAMPAEFVVEELAGKTLHYRVRLGAIHQRVLAAADDALAERAGAGKTFAELEERVRQAVAERKRVQNLRAQKNRIMEELLKGPDFELPESIVRDETRRILQEIVRENSARGISEEELQENRTQIVEGAALSARERVKGSYILLRIADKEGIEVDDRELHHHLHHLADRVGMNAHKLERDLKRRDALDGIREELLVTKTLDFLASKGSVPAS